MHEGGLRVPRLDLVAEDELGAGGPVGVGADEGRDVRQKGVEDLAGEGALPCVSTLLV